MRCGFVVDYFPVILKADKMMNITRLAARKNNS
jgi:hypothetical protein